MHDLVIRNGSVVDGVGTPAFHADVAIDGDRITQVGRVDGGGLKEIDADGHIICPGFINGHTHLDAQLFWDHLGTSSCFHGVTTAIFGNCGFSIAPVDPDRPDLVSRNLERAEDIPRAALETGVDWKWGTFAEYLSAVDSVPKVINYAANIGHSALRPWVMGERAFEEEATEDDVLLMEKTLTEAIQAGAIGFSTSLSAHIMPDGRPVASRLATWSELRRLVAVLSREGGIFQFAKRPVTTVEQSVSDEIYANIIPIAIGLGVPVTWDTLHPADLAPVDKIVAAGGRAYGQTVSRYVNTLSTFRLKLPFDHLPLWREVRREDLGKQRLAYEDPRTRERLVREALDGVYLEGVGAEHPEPAYDRMIVMDSVFPPFRSVAEIAAERRVEPPEAMIQLGLETDFHQIFCQQLRPLVSEDEILAMMKHPNTVMTLSDAGAHVGQISDYSLQTYLLSYWVHRRNEFSLEEAVKMLTAVPAHIWGLRERGAVREGFVADLNVFNAEQLAPNLPTVVQDFPGQVKRFYQTATGFLATIVGGRLVLESGAHTGDFPGRLLRSSRVG